MGVGCRIASPTTRVELGSQRGRRSSVQSPRAGSGLPEPKRALYGTRALFHVPPRPRQEDAAPMPRILNAHINSSRTGMS